MQVSGRGALRTVGAFVIEFAGAIQVHFGEDDEFRAKPFAAAHGGHAADIVLERAERLADGHLAHLGQCDGECAAGGHPVLLSYVPLLLAFTIGTHER